MSYTSVQLRAAADALRTYHKRDNEDGDSDDLLATAFMLDTIAWAWDQHGADTGKILLDTVYMVANPKSPQGIIYARPATTPGTAWENVVEYEIMGSAATRRSLEAKGWRAKKVNIILAE